MLDPELLDLLICPESRLPVAPADPELIARVNAAIAAGGVRNRGGGEVREPLAAALLRQDGDLLYPVRDGIPIMLINEGIFLDTLPG